MTDVEFERVFAELHLAVGANDAYAAEKNIAAAELRAGRITREQAIAYLDDAQAKKEAAARRRQGGTFARVVKSVDRAGGATLAALSKAPGASSAAIVATGGLAALNKNVRKTGTKEIAMGAAAGGALAGGKLAGLFGDNGASLADAEAARTPTTSPGELEAIDAAAGGANLAGLSARTNPPNLDQAEARAPLLVGIGAVDPVLLVGGALAVGLLVLVISRR